MANQVHASNGGLSSHHISPRPIAGALQSAILADLQGEAQLEVYADADFSRARRELTRYELEKAAFRLKARKGKKRPWKRGAIQTFTWPSRLRLQKLIAKVKRNELPYFMGLTYPETWPADYHRWKRDLDVFWKRVERLYPLAGAFWRLENQKRGAPHYHLLVWNMARKANAKRVRLWLSRVWYEVVGSGDEKHLRAGTRIEKVRSYRGVKAYVAKALGRVACEVSKTSQADFQYVGRWWGVLGRENIPWGTRQVFGCSQTVACILIRHMRRYARIRSRAYKSLSVLGAPATWLTLRDFYEFQARTTSSP